MERVQVKAEPRTPASKGHLRQLRQKGLVPGVVYGRNKEAVTVTVDGKDLAGVLGHSSGMNTLVDLAMDGGKDTVMVKELTRDILYHDRLTHVDFIRISLEDKLEVNVPVQLIGEPQGVRDGGVVQQSLREVVMKCLPTAIPEMIELDVTGLGTGQSLTVADLVTTGDVEMISDSAEVVVTVLAPRVAEEEEKHEEAAEAGAEEETEEG
ncbi:MAG: 50S ribosomal protein L25 [Dethiobacter sp.]|nr:50S ribosomal protein L25 [Dethiobacter sp.]